jgi:hypothetical protein
MANQTASPNEAAIAKKLLEEMGEPVEKPFDPFQHMNFRDARGQYESEDTFRARTGGFQDYQYEFYRQAYENIFKRRPPGATPPREEPKPPPRQEQKPPDSKTRMYLRQKEAYDSLLKLYRAFRQDMSSAEYKLWEALLQRMDPNGVYFSEKILEWEREQVRQRYYEYKTEYAQNYGNDFESAYDWANENSNSAEEARRKADEALKAQAMRDEERRKQEAADKAAQKIKDERERRERDEAMGSFEKWFHEFKRDKS